MTIATGSPIMRTLPSARIGRFGCTAPPNGFEAHGTPPSSPRFAAVSTLTTPGMPSAAELSMLLMVACACGERTKAAKAMPGSLMSST